VRYLEQRLVRGEPAQALLDTVGNDPASVIVVGNRGLGAAEGHLLGSVPREVVKNAVCDVIIVQTSALDERVLGEQLAKAPANRASAVPRSNPGG
jgi:maltose/moltooligosaccharide transporter